jgi:hypothetical protein
MAMKHNLSRGLSSSRGKLYLTQEQWEAYRGDGRKVESSPSMGGRKRGKPHKARGGA